MTLAVAWLAGRRLMLSRTQLSALIPMVLASAALTTVFLVVHSTTLSRSQVITRDFGEFDARTSVPIPFGDRLAPTRIGDLRRAVQGAGGREPVISIVSSGDFSPDSLARHFSTGPIQVVTYLEDQAPTSSPPMNYDLAAGRWPQAAGEVVVTPRLWEKLERKDTFTVLSGAATLHVTGVAENRFGTRSWAILAAPGTWANLPAARILAGDPRVSGLAHIYWKGEVDRQTMTSALAEVDSTGWTADEIASGYATRHQASAPTSLIEYNPLVYRYPALVLCVLVGSVLVNRRAPHLRRCLDRLQMVGLRAAPLRWTFTAMMTLSAVAAVAAGVGLGWLAAAIARVPLAGMVSQPLSPLTASHLWSQALALIVATAGACLLFGVWRLRPEPTRPARLSRLVGFLPWALLRRLAIPVLLIRAAQAIGGTFDMDALGSAMFHILGAFILLAPDIGRLGTALLPRRFGVSLTARRLIEADRLRYSIVALALASCLSAPTVLSTFVATQQRTAEAQNTAAVAPHQIWVDVVANGGTSVLERRIDDLIQSTLQHATPPVRVSTLSSTRFTRGRPASGSFGVLVVSSVSELERLLEISLSPNDRRTIESGGLVDWSGAVGRQGLVTEGDGQAAELTTGPIPTVTLSVTESWNNLAAGAVLASTAAVHRLPIDPTTMSVYTGLQDHAIRAAVAAVRHDGISERFVMHHVPPLPLEPPVDWYVAAGGLACAALLILTLVMTSQTRHLRAYAAMFLALGLRRRWSTRVLGLQIGVTFVSGLLAAIPASVIPVWLLAHNNVRLGLLLDIPMQFIALALAASVIAALTAVTTALVGLRATHNAAV